MEFALGSLATAVTVIITAVVTAYFTQRTEHRRWLRQERLRAYSVLLAVSTDLEQLVRNSGGEAAKIAALHATEAAHADVDVLGPKSAREAATGLLVSHVGEGEMTDRARAQAAFVKVAAKVLGTSEWRDGS